MGNVLHRFFRILVLVFVLAVGLGVFTAAVWPGQWEDLADILAVQRGMMIWVGLGIFLLGVLFAWTGVRRKKRNRFLTFSNDGGTVSISTGAIADYVSKLAGEFPSIISMSPVVVPLRHAIDLIVDVRVKAGPQIHEVCESLQARVRECVTGGLGISEVRRVTISVHEINSEHRSN